MCVLTSPGRVLINVSYRTLRPKLRLGFADLSLALYETPGTNKMFVFVFVIKLKKKNREIF